MISIEKPVLDDIENIREIMSFWTEKEEVEKYIERIKDEINGSTQFNLQFWVVKDNAKAVGIIGLCDPLPKIISFAKKEKPGELKILYLNKDLRGKGIGKVLIQYFENEAKKQGYQEILVRSAERYRDTAYGFYEKMGYKKVGTVTSGDDPKPMQVFEKEI